MTSKAVTAVPAAAIAGAGTTERPCTPTRLLSAVVQQHVLPCLTARDVLSRLGCTNRAHCALAHAPNLWRTRTERTFDAAHIRAALQNLGLEALMARQQRQ